MSVFVAVPVLLGSRKTITVLQERTKMKRDIVLILLALTIATLMAVKFFSPEETVERKSIESKSVETDDSQIEEKLEAQKRHLEAIKENAARKRQEKLEAQKRQLEVIEKNAARKRQEKEKLEVRSGGQQVC